MLNRPGCRDELSHALGNFLARMTLNESSLTPLALTRVCQRTGRIRPHPELRSRAARLLDRKVPDEAMYLGS